MRILHLYKDYPPVAGGMEGHVALLAREQARRGLEVTVLVTSPDARTSVEEEEGVRVIRAGRWATVASAPLSPGLVRWVRRLETDVSHLHFPYPFAETAHLLFGRSRATVVTYQSDIVRQRWLGRLYRPLMLRFLKKCDRILATSPQYLESSPVLRRFRAKCSVVPLGIDPTPFLEEHPRRARELRRVYGSPLVLFVGRLRYYKGVEYLIEAMERIEARLLIVGVGPRESALRERAAQSPARDRIRFLGEIPDADLPAYYAAADVFVLPSSHRSEAYGLVQLEAMAAGTPVVSTELGTGTSFVNRHRETGLVVPPRDPGALAAAVDELLAHPERRRELGRQARCRVLEELHCDRMVERILAIYREISGGCR